MTILTQETEKCFILETVYNFILESMENNLPFLLSINIINVIILKNQFVTEQT